METSQLLYRLWAKTNNYDRNRAKRQDEADPGWLYHPLPCHLIDVGHVAESWLEADPHLLRRFCILWPDVPPEEVRRVLVLAAALHDLGKLYPDFQDKSEEGWAHGYGRVWSGPQPVGRGFDHGAGTGSIFNTLLARGGLPGVDPAWKPLMPLMRVAAGHHGRLYDDGDIAVDRSLRHDVRFRSLIQSTLDDIIALFGPLPHVGTEPSTDFLMLAAGFVSIVDWLGSDSRYFTFAPEVDGLEAARSYLQALREKRVGRDALNGAGLLSSFDPPGRFEDLFEGWAPRAGFQAEACKVPFGEEDGPEIAIVEAPMGLGKTEIALHLAAGAIRRNTASGVYFALPTQATSNALFDRVLAFTKRIKGDQDLAVTLAHGGSQYFEAYRKLAGRGRMLAFTRAARSASDDTEPSEVIAPSWMLSSKRALLAPVGLGTIDQAMLGGMAVRHGFVRLFGLSRKVVVFDEIHAYDAYMNVLIVHLLRWLRALGAKVILLSATLPQGLRNELLGAYGVEGISLNEPASAPYPQLLHAAPGAALSQVVDPRPASERPRKTVYVNPVEASDLTAEGVAQIRAVLARGGCVAWIRNTVREAQDAWRQLRAAGIEADLLHARFVRSDRNYKEDDLLRRFGSPQHSGANRPARRVVVATQVIEQSVDVDFDWMLSDLAPVDLLLQRAGRLWRHENRSQRHGHERPVLTVLMPDADARAALRFGSSAYVYDADTLARSAILVHENPAWRLPEACRTLVAELYDRDETYWNAARLGCDADALDLARGRTRKQLDAMVSLAGRARVSPPGSVPVMREVRGDGESDVAVGVSTRYGGQSAALVLFRSTPAGAVPIGGSAPLQPPPDDDFRARLAVEEAVAMATVAFPWYGSFPGATAPEPLDPLAAWWKRRHPYDDRVFVLLAENGEIETDYLSGSYDPGEGLVLNRSSTTPADAPAPFEDF